MAKHKYYITSSGLTAERTSSLYAAVLSDAIARHRRMTGFEVAHLIAREARASQPDHDGNSKMLDEIGRLAEAHSTHSVVPGSRGHILAVQALLRDITRHSWSAIYKAKYEGRYCVQDQIDIRDSSDSGRCPVCGEVGQLVSEERHFFRLSSFQGKLHALYKYRPQLLQPGSRRKEIEQFIANEMKDIAISRKSAEPGVPWPADPSHVVSREFSNLVTYLSALGFGGEGHASDDFRKYWPADLHVIDAGGLLQHAVYWPAFLIAAGLPAPRHIFAYGTISLGQEAHDVLALEQFARQFGSDSLRYCLLREVPYDADVHLANDRIAALYEADLVRGYGGLAKRILRWVAQYCGGKIPPPAMLPNFNPTIESATADARAEVRFLFDNNAFSEGLQIIQRLIALVDRALADASPTNAGTAPGRESRLGPLIHDACQALAIITLMLHPVAPHATDMIWRSLGQDTRLDDQLIDETSWCSLIPGTPIGRVEEIFPPIPQSEKAIASAER